MSRLEFFDMIGYFVKSCAPRVNTKRIQRAERKRKILTWNLKTKEIFYTLLTTHLPIYSACLFPILISLHPNSPSSSRPSLCLPPYILVLSLLPSSLLNHPAILPLCSPYVNSPSTTFTHPSTFFFSLSLPIFSLSFRLWHNISTLFPRRCV